MSERIFIKGADLAYLLQHPVDTAKVIALRIEGQILDDFALGNYNGIPLADAVRGFRRNKKVEPTGTIRMEDWPESAQADFKKGVEIRPDGRHPEHSNV